MNSEEEEAMEDLVNKNLEILKKNAWFSNTFDLSTLEFLGKGNYGVVFSAYHKNFKRKIALKVIASKKERINQVIDELINMKTLKHGNILETLEHHLIFHKKLIFLLLIMEQGHISLKDYLTERPKGMNESELCETMKVLSSAISYAHQNKIVHCDLKPGNIILFKNSLRSDYSCYNMKISDWGSAFQFKEFNNDSATTVKSGMNFTPIFLAPELHIFEEGNEKIKKANFFAGDVYALGITLLICAGIKLKEIGGLSGEQDKEIYNIKIKKLLEKLKKNEISIETTDKIRRMIKFQAKKRVLPFLDEVKREVIYNLKHFSNNFHFFKIKEPQDLIEQETIRKKLIYSLKKE